MSVLFLDIDGVLNSKSFLVGKASDTWPIAHIDPKAIELLNEIVEKTNCQIVISSSWRAILQWEKLTQVLASAGFRYPKAIIGQTPRANFDNRGMEIAAWLEACPTIKSFVIVDDDADMAHLMPHLVQTQWEVGLTQKIARRIIKRLTRPQV